MPDFAWIGGEMVVFVALVDDIMVLGPPSLVEQVQAIRRRPSRASAMGN